MKRGCREAVGWIPCNAPAVRQSVGGLEARGGFGGRSRLGAAATKEAARALLVEGSMEAVAAKSVVPMRLAGQGLGDAVWESEWQWRIERANVLRMNGPNSRERERLSLCGLCTDQGQDQE